MKITENLLTLVAFTLLVLSKDVCESETQKERKKKTNFYRFISLSLFLDVS